MALELVPSAHAHVPDVDHVLRRGYHVVVSHLEAVHRRRMLQRLDAVPRQAVPQLDVIFNARRDGTEGKCPSSPYE